jgi:hypothetical protein
MRVESTRMCVVSTRMRVEITIERVKITLIRVEITLERVKILFERVKITLCVLRSHDSTRNLLLCMQSSANVSKHESTHRFKIKKIFQRKDVTMMFG